MSEEARSELDSRSTEAQFTKESAVRLERIVPGPIDRVWDFLIQPSRLPEWYGEGTIEGHPGGVVRLMSGHIRGVVTQWQPPRRLTYTWNVFAPNQTESDYPESYLSFSLQPHDSNVLLTVYHVPVLSRFEKQNAMGWHTFLDMLSEALSGKTVQPREVYMKRNAARYGVDLANLVK